MVNNVVNVSGFDTEICVAAVSAPRFFGKLHWPKIIRPDWQLVQLMPLLSSFAAKFLFLRSMSVAISVSYQLAASWMSAWSQRFASHGLSPPWPKTKAPEPTTRDLSQCHWLRRFTLWPSMSRIISDLQSRHQTGKCFAVVSGVTLSSFLLRLQIGQATHPSDTLIIPQSFMLFNRFPPFLFRFSIRYTWFQVQINIRKFSYSKYPGLK